MISPPDDAVCRYGWLSMRLPPVHRCRESHLRLVGIHCRTLLRQPPSAHPPDVVLVINTLTVRIFNPDTCELPGRYQLPGL
jgi:hypothetical protein